MINGWRQPQSKYHRTTPTGKTRKEVERKVKELKGRGYHVLTNPEVLEEVSLFGDIYYVSVLERKAPSK